MSAHGLIEACQVVYPRHYYLNSLFRPSSMWAISLGFALVATVFAVPLDARQSAPSVVIRNGTVIGKTASGIVSRFPRDSDTATDLIIRNLSAPSHMHSHRSAIFVFAHHKYSHNAFPGHRSKQHRQLRRALNLRSRWIISTPIFSSLDCLALSSPILSAR